MGLGSILIWAIVGGVAGILAEWMVGNISTGCISSAFIGLVGALIGGWLFIFLGYSIGTGILNDVLTSAIGAIALLVLVKFIRWE